MKARQTIVSGLLVCLLVGFVALLVTRQRTPHTAPQPVVAVAATSSATVPTLASASAAAVAAAAPDAGAPDAAADPSAVASAAATASADSAEPDAGTTPALDRPLRVITLGWELAAPGMTANDGFSPGPKSVFSSAGLDVRIAQADAMAPIEEALARGGGDEKGADVAIAPLPSFLASYERLRALSPEVFFVVGFSRGREALAGSDPLPTGPVKGGVKLAGAPGTPATFLGLFVLDVAGVPPSEVHLVAPGGKDEKEVPYAAIDRATALEETPSGRKILLTTADASRLVPFVAIAPHGFITSHERAAAALARGWLEGTRKLAADPPGTARQLAGAEGAPEPLSLLRRLGDVQPASLADNARLAGLTGKSALTLTALFDRGFGLWRGVSTLAMPAPEKAPIATSVIASLVRAGGAQPEGEAAAVKPAGEGTKALVVHRQEKLNEDGLVDTIGLLAAVFERSTLRVSVQPQGLVDGGKTKKVIEAALGKFELAESRLVVAKKAGARNAAAVVEVLALP
ncbi:hypothetical protein [Polyangium aurulentum]|uniref:hypothetical protein n=1 Tax=Polyangium aurulentum TaxID=2567896 RepID=UPI0010AE1E47|nr:hypothetical protein [Polyangium aurulentum]UQA60146.1 hypothetical protein E8A73_006590 [Polyangium aurulentum]